MACGVMSAVKILYTKYSWWDKWWPAALPLHRWQAHLLSDLLKNCSKSNSWSSWQLNSHLVLAHLKVRLKCIILSMMSIINIGLLHLLSIIDRVTYMDMLMGMTGRRNGDNWWEWLQQYTNTCCTQIQDHVPCRPHKSYAVLYSHWSQVVGISSLPNFAVITDTLLQLLIQLQLCLIEL